MPAAAIFVRPRPGHPAQGLLICNGRAQRVALGGAGIRANKREGDNATPAGLFHPVRLWFHPDRLARPLAALPVRRITAADGWCEDPADRRYNRPIRLKPGQAGDRLARPDSLYDLVVEIDHNARPRVAGRGSAVFVHVARPGLAPTAGCIALPAPALRRLLARLGQRTRLYVGTTGIPKARLRP